MPMPNDLLAGPFHFRLRPVAVLIAVAAFAFVLGTRASSLEPTGRPRGIGPLGPGFYDPSAPPPPEGMIRPKPGSWDGVRPPRGYQVVLLTAGDDHSTTTLVTAVRHW